MNAFLFTTLVNRAAAARSLFVTLLIVLGALASSAWALPLAAKGWLDLRAVDLARSVRLDGEWEFYPGRLLSPPAFAGPNPVLAADHLALPGSWRGFVKDGRELDGSGVATFRLQILPPPHGERLALRIFDVQSAYRLWANGKLVSARGLVGDRPESERADPSLDTPTLPDDGTPLELVLEVSNHHYRDGGLNSSIVLGSEQGIRSSQSRRWALALFFVGGLLVMGCYHLFYYGFRRSHTAPLYFGLYCLLWMANFLASRSSDWVILLFLPAASADWLQRVDATCFLLSVPVGYLYFRSLFPDEFSPTIFKASAALFGGFIAFALGASLSTVQFVLPFSYLASLLLIVYSLARLNKARRQRREGASFILGGFAILGVIAANDMLNDLQLIRSVDLIHVGMFCFIISQGFAFSLGLSRAFFAVESLSADLEERNLALELEVAERVRLEHEIVNTSENERRCLSQDLHDGLCQDLTAARLRYSVLERKLGGAGQGGAELAELARLLDASVNHAYELSRGLWPIDHEPPGMSAFLEDFCRRLAASHGITITVRNLRACSIYPKDNSNHLYRIAQEAINNAVKHARASLIEVSLDCAAEHALLTLCVRDNGVGIDCANPASSVQGGLGLRIMAHRARMIGGELTIENAKGGGTEVTCRILCEHCVQNCTSI